MFQKNKKKLTKQGQWVLFGVWRPGLALIKVGVALLLLETIEPANDAAQTSWF